MPMVYGFSALPDTIVPRASSPVFQHLVDVYAAETNKVISVWKEFSPEEMAFRPHPRSSTVLEIMQHQLLSERRFFGEFLGLAEPPAARILPQGQTPEDFADRMRRLALPRLGLLAAGSEVYLRLLGRKVPPTYGPTADVRWEGADPTHTVEAADRQ